ncbi:MAG: hypothetical protein A2Y62_16885 [Candidatus Fischerbacteria bacterium RBG_13_37_8]|uniref:Methyltransferase type 11 domain-containing protein n=1 Tax=Candidatus Fischerbacteria bacterium RBG_13_37_8 TaxID=1817863 RepID=A0A1F5VDQ6_9BACT|nr:MAG: hypothetical protein A2Y62_16885 [Candidatus Fischerbacteria bacterium RBG_13_37_8]
MYQKISKAGEEHEFQYAHFNVETDKFPYENDSFECVLFCDIIEHLLINPNLALLEIRRIVQSNGYLILTTPNVTRLGNVIKLLKGKNIYDGYSPFGIYGRHNREYTLNELLDLLQMHQFDPTEIIVKNIYPHPWKSLIVQALRPKAWHEHIFLLAQKTVINGVGP